MTGTVKRREPVDDAERTSPTASHEGVGWTGPACTGRDKVVDMPIAARMPPCDNMDRKGSFDAVIGFKNALFISLALWLSFLILLYLTVF